MGALSHRYKRYIVFSFPDYYPGGGLGDCSYDTDSLSEALVHIEEIGGENVELFDRVAGLELDPSTGRKYK